MTMKVVDSRIKVAVVPDDQFSNLHGKSESLGRALKTALSNMKYFKPPYKMLNVSINQFAIVVCAHLYALPKDTLGG